MIGIGATLNQRFLLEKELGRGGMGAVYSATDQRLQRSVAIKLLKDQGGEEVGRRLRLEAQIAARLLHENVVRIYDFDQAEGTSYLVMEQVDGTSYGKRWRQLPLHERLRILAQVADALDYAHHQGVIHRDVKPGNVLLTAQDVAKLSDFGLSMIAESAEQSGVIRGTPHYMSPEQAKARRVDHRTDLYSLGVMVYESATGTLPFVGSAISVITQHSTATPERPRLRSAEVSEPLERLILDLMAKDPEARLSRGAAAAAVLREEAAKLRAMENTTQIPVEALGLGLPPTSPATGVGPTTATHDETSRGLPPPDASLMALPLGPGTLAGAGRAPAVPPPGADAPAQAQGSASASSPAAAAAAVPPRVPPAPPPPPATTSADLVTSELVRKMLRAVLEEPLPLTAEERYLYGHYLAYLLIGARRRGFFGRRKLERRNADRARLILGLTYAMTAGGGEEAVADAAALLDRRIEVRPALSPTIVAKYLAWRDTPAHRKLLRKTRKAVQEASAYARKRMLDARGVLNPGLIPRSLDDLRKIAPPRDEVDDDLVERWNRLADVWRDRPEFRSAALRYAAGRSYRDPSGDAMWAEVVYPLIELARFQRQGRNPGEALWDFLLGRVLRVPDPGVQLDRALDREVPAEVVRRLDDSARLLEQMLARYEPEDHLDLGEETDQVSLPKAGHLEADARRLGQIADERDDDPRRDIIRLVDPDPIRFLQGQLHELWLEGVQELQKPQRPGQGGRPASHRHIPVGPFRLVVIPSIRGASAGQVAIQGMPNKQIEMLTPSFRAGGSSGRPILAIWVYRDNSLVITHYDFRSSETYVIWDHPRGHQHHYHDPADVYRELARLRLEAPEQLESALSRRFRPSRRA